MNGELITKVFEARNASHIKHWKTESYAEHEALGEFYDNVIDILDKYMEAHIAAFETVDDIPEDAKDVKKLLKENMLWLNKNREKLAGNVPALENILDELSGQYLSTLFKLERLR